MVFWDLHRIGVSIGVSVLGRDRGAPPSLHHPQSRRQLPPPSPFAYLKAGAPEGISHQPLSHTHQITTHKTPNHKHDF